MSASNFLVVLFPVDNNHDYYDDVGEEGQKLLYGIQNSPPLSSVTATLAASTAPSKSIHSARREAFRL